MEREIKLNRSREADEQQDAEQEPQAQTEIGEIEARPEWR